MLSYKMHYVNFALSMCNYSNQVYFVAVGGGIPAV